MKSVQRWSTTGKSKSLYEQAHRSTISALFRSRFTAQVMNWERIEDDMSAGEDGIVRVLRVLRVLGCVGVLSLRKVLWAPMAIRRLNVGANRIRCVYHICIVRPCLEDDLLPPPQSNFRYARCITRRSPSYNSSTALPVALVIRCSFQPQPH